MVTETKQEYGFQTIIQRRMGGAECERCAACGSLTVSRAFQDAVFGPFRRRAEALGIQGHEYACLTNDMRAIRCTFYFDGTHEQRVAFEDTLDGLSLTGLVDGMEFDNPTFIEDDAIIDGTFAAELMSAVRALQEQA